MSEQEKKKAETAKKPGAAKTDSSTPKTGKPKGGVTINKKTRSNG